MGYGIEGIGIHSEVQIPCTNIGLTSSVSKESWTRVFFLWLCRRGKDIKFQRDRRAASKKCRDSAIASRCHDGRVVHLRPTSTMFICSPTPNMQYLMHLTLYSITTGLLQYLTTGPTQVHKQPKPIPPSHRPPPTPQPLIEGPSNVPSPWPVPGTEEPEHSCIWSLSIDWDGSICPPSMTRSDHGACR